MPKQYHVINDFSGGLNNKKDPRDIADNELSHIQNMSIDALGKIKTIGKFYAHIKDQDGATSFSSPYYISEVASNITGSGGYGLFYFESDHSRGSDNTIINTVGSTKLAIGETNTSGNISFVKADTAVDSGGESAESGGGSTP